MSSAESLAISAKFGNNSDLEALINKLTPSVRMLAKSLAQQMPGDIDELVTDGITAINAAVAKWEPNGPASFTTYSMRCARNAMLNRMRSISKYRHMVSISAIEENSLPISRPIVIETIEDLEGTGPVADIAISALRQMSRSQREIALMVLQRKPIDDIAATLGISVAEVRTRLKVAVDYIMFEVQLKQPTGEMPLLDGLSDA